MGLISGTDLRIQLGTTPLGYATSCTMSLSAETKESISKDSTSSWSEVTIGQLSGSLGFEGLLSFDDTINSVAVEDVEGIYDNFAAKTSVTWKFTDSTTGNIEWSGSGFITSLELGAPVEENATYSGTITMSGAPSKATIA